MSKPAVILLSGGLDSATAAAVARRDGFDLYALSFDYGQRHQGEVHAAQALAAALEVVEHKIATIDLGTFGGSALTTHELAIPKADADVETAGRQASGGPTTAGGSAIPITYVPARNTIFLSFALAWAEVLDSTDIFIGINAVDYSGYPDCRPEYLAAFEALARLATRAGVEGGALTVHAPLLHLSKAEIITLGQGLGVDYAKTVSCYDLSVEGLACGGCDACRLRRKGFVDAGIADPTAYLER